jgi:hypothetical protein
MNVVLIPLFVYAYARIISTDGLNGGRTSEMMPILVAITGIQVAICAGGVLVEWATQLRLPLSGGALIVVVTVVLAVRKALGMPQRTVALGTG